jgi:hypothetical protein
MLFQIATLGFHYIYYYHEDRLVPVCNPVGMYYVPPASAHFTGTMPQGRSAKGQVP